MVWQSRFCCLYADNLVRHGVVIFKRMFGVMIKASSAVWRHVFIIYRDPSSVANHRRFACAACWEHNAIPHNVKLNTLCILRWRDKSSHNGTQKRLRIATEGMFYVHSLFSTWEFYWRIWIPHESICKHIWPRKWKTNLSPFWSLPETHRYVFPPPSILPSPSWSSHP